MTPKEKAKELIDKYFDLNWDWDGVTKYEWAREGALIAVQNIISANPHSNPLNTDTHSTMKWWQEVKSEIEKL